MYHIINIVIIILIENILSTDQKSLNKRALTKIVQKKVIQITITTKF